MSTEETVTARAVGERLRLIRQAMGMSQAELCRTLNILPQTWNNFEKGVNRIKPPDAFKVRKLTGATSDYIYFGDTRGMPFDLMQEIERIAREEGDPSQRIALGA